MGNDYLAMGKVAIVSAHIYLANGSQRAQLLTETGLDTWGFKKSVFYLFFIKISQNGQIVNPL